MNERFDPSLQHKISKQKFIENTTAGGASFEDTRSQFTQDAFKNEKPEQTQQDIEEAKRQLERSYLSNNNVNNDERMRQALLRFNEEQAKIKNPEKQKQMEEDWRWSEISQKEALQKKQERAERKSSPESTSVVAVGSRFSTEPKGLALEQKQKDMDQGWSHNEKVTKLQTQLTRLQEALSRAHQAGDTELVDLLEEQEKNLLNTIEENYSSSNLSQEQKISIGKINIETQQNKKSFNIPESLITDVEFKEIQGEENNPKKNLEESIEKNEKEVETQSRQQESAIPLSAEEQISENKIYVPSEETLSKLEEMGIKYEDLVQVVPDFATMSEGQQAYILYKTEEQSVNKIKDLSEQRFQAEKKSSGWFTRNFRQGKLKREAIRVAANDYRGLQSFSEDIAGITSRIKENDNEIVIEDNGNYRIEYAKVPPTLDEKDPFRIRVENYNRSATALSDVPYEWSLPTASKAERRIFEKALKEFNLHEKSIMEVRDKIGENHGDILMDMHILRTKVEGDQLLSSYKDAGVQISDMKTATWTSNLKKSFGEVFSAKHGNKLAIVSSASIARVFSKALYGFGGSVGASAIIGGFLGYRKKNEQFNKDAKEARKGGEIKDTTNSVFDAKNTTKRINHLVSQLENETDPIKREAVLQTLDNRLQILDQRIKQGRVNFGKTKDQLSNKNELVSAMTLALVKRYEIGKMGQVSERADQFLQKQDKKTKVERRKERVKGVVVGAMFGAGAATATFIIADWFNGDDTAKAIKAAIDTDPEVVPIPVKIPNPTDFEVSVDASPRGAIATYENLQQELIEKYPDPELRPPHVQEFIDTPAEKLAMEDNMYRPGEVNESAKIYKGGKLGFNANGERFYTDTRNGMDILSGDGKFDGEHFDYKAYSEANAGSGSVPSESISAENTPKPDNIFNAPKPAFVEVQPGVQEHINLSKNIGVDFSIDKGLRGGMVSTFHDVNPDDFNAYHKAYLRTDVKSYVDYLTKETNFFRDNVGISQEQANSQLKDLVNQMIMRDQVLQEGNLDPNSEAYKILTNERNELEKFINTKFGNGKDIIYDFDGKRYPDPNYVFEKNPGSVSDTVSSSQESVAKAQNIVTPENTNIQGVKDVTVKNNVINQDLKFRFTKTPDGHLLYSADSIDPNKIPDEYIKQRLGFNPDWRKISGLPQTFESEATYRRLTGNIYKIKIALAGMDSFPPNTEEYQAFKGMLNTMIKMTERDYPEIFNYQTN